MTHSIQLGDRSFNGGAWWSCMHGSRQNNRRGCLQVITRDYSTIELSQKCRMEQMVRAMSQWHACVLLDFVKLTVCQSDNFFGPSTEMTRTVLLAWLYTRYMDAFLVEVMLLANHAMSIRQEETTHQNIDLAWRPLRTSPFPMANFGLKVWGINISIALLVGNYCCRCYIQPGAFITQSNITWYCINNCNCWNIIWIIIWIHKRHPISHRNGWAMRCFYKDLKQNSKQSYLYSQNCIEYRMGWGMN